MQDAHIGLATDSASYYLVCRKSPQVANLGTPCFQRAEYCRFLPKAHVGGTRSISIDWKMQGLTCSSVSEVLCIRVICRPVDRGTTRARVIQHDPANLKPSRPIPFRKPRLLTGHRYSPRTLPIPPTWRYQNLVSRRLSSENCSSGT
jgi:hypothetical protein